MCNDVVELVGLVVFHIFHCYFSGFIDIVVGCTKMGFKIDPIFLDWSHSIPGFDFILELPCTVDDRVGCIGHMDLGVQGSRYFPLL